MGKGRDSSSNSSQEAGRQRRLVILELSSQGMTLLAQRDRYATECGHGVAPNGVRLRANPPLFGGLPVSPSGKGIGAGCGTEAGPCPTGRIALNPLACQRLDQKSVALGEKSPGNRGFRVSCSVG